MGNESATYLFEDWLRTTVSLRLDYDWGVLRYLKIVGLRSVAMLILIVALIDQPTRKAYHQVINGENYRCRESLDDDIEV